MFNHELAKADQFSNVNWGMPTISYHKHFTSRVNDAKWEKITSKIKRSQGPAFHANSQARSAASLKQAQAREALPESDEEMDF